MTLKMKMLGLVSLPLLLTMVVVDAHGLTTFGKSPNNNQNQLPPPPPVRGRECAVEADCLGIQNASCVPDPRDHKLRCLCGDNNAPTNGVCSSRVKGPRHSCSSDTECMLGAECKPSPRGRATSQKVCACMEGYVEVNYQCSGTTGLTSLAALVAAAVFLSMQF